MGGGQNVYAEVLDLPESGEPNVESFGESIESAHDSPESKSESALESIESKIDSPKSTLKSSPNQSTLWQSTADKKTGGFLGFEYGLGAVKVSIDNDGNALKAEQVSAYINIIFGY